jgi:uncharacterized protein (TIGR00251 family)
MRIQVGVKTNSKVDEIVENSGKYIIKVREPPKEGKANKKVISLIAKYFAVPQNSVTIISGLNNRNKVVEIANI